MAYEKEVLAQVAKKEYVPPSNQTVGELALKWHDNKTAQAYRRSTLESWRNHVERFIVPALGPSKDRCRRCSDRLRAAAATWSEKTSPKTANKILTTLTAILDMAERHGDIKRNPAEKAERLKVATEEDNAIEVEPDKVYTRPSLEN